MAESAVTYLLPKLGSLITDEARLLVGVEEQVTSIRDELQWIRSFLKDADKKRNKFERVDVWVRQIRDLAYQAEDVIDVFLSKLELQRQRNSIRRFIYYPDQLITLHKLSGKINDIDRKLEKISTYKSRYNIENLEAGETLSHSNGFLESKESILPNVEDVGLVGFEEEAKELSKLLTETKPKQFHVVSIIAMGGIGKTTLAKKLYNDVNQHFNFFSWVLISQEYRIGDLLLRVARDVIKEAIERDKLQNLKDNELKEKLQEILKGKTFLIVLDDLWRTSDWDALQENLLIKGNDTKTTVLITSRKEEVAKRAKQSIYIHEDDKSSCKIHELRLLNSDESWELFLKKVFVVTSATPSNPEEWEIQTSSAETKNFKKSRPRECGNLPSSSETHYSKELKNLSEQSNWKEMEILGKKIVAKCGGLPLAIVVLGGLLSRKEKTYTEWSKVLESVNWRLNQEETQCQQVLALSYADLPYYLKSCFLYLGLFPEDYEIDANRLIRLWVAEGFIEPRGEETLEDVGEDCIEELSQRSMILVNRVGRRVEKCHIHDLLRDVAISEAKRDKFLATCETNREESSTNPSRRVSIQFKKGKYHHPATNIGLHSLLCFSESLELHLSGQRTLLLRVLDLENVKNVKRLPTEIGQLILLKYFSLRNTDVRKLPSSIKKLHHLQTLDLYNSPIVELSSEIWEMKQLRHVFFARHWSLGGELIQCPPQRICGLRDIHTLWLRAGKWIEGGLEELINLKVLRIEGDPQKYADAIADAIVKLVRLRELYIDYYWSWNNGVQHLDCPSLPHISLSSHVQLYKLMLAIRLENLPQSNHFPANLTELELSFGHLTPEDDPMEPLQNLPNLRTLYIRDFAARKLTCSRGGFPQLQSFEMYYFYCLEEWVVEKGAFPNLRVLNIGHCHGLQEIPEGFAYVRTLKELIFVHMLRQFTEWAHTKSGDTWEKFKHIPTITDRDCMGDDNQFVRMLFVRDEGFIPVSEQ